MAGEKVYNMLAYQLVKYMLLELDTHIDLEIIIIYMEGNDFQINFNIFLILCAYIKRCRD